MNDFDVNYTPEEFIELKDRLKFNLLTLKPELDGVPLPNEFIEFFYIKLGEIGWRIGKEPARDTLIYASQQICCYDPVVQYLQDLEQQEREGKLYQADIENIISFCRKTATAILPRGGGTSQCGQTVNHAIVVDNTKYLNNLISVDLEENSCVVEPGIVLDDLNKQLKGYGLWFPVDVSTSSRATIGGMTANNSCGGRSIRYGIMRDNVLSIDAILTDGTRVRFGPEDESIMPDAMREHLLELGRNNSNLIEERFPKVLRRVGGYNLDALIPDAMSARPDGKQGDGINFAHLLLGSEGTLSYFTSIKLKLSQLPAQKLMGICHFPSFYHELVKLSDLQLLDQ